MSVSIMYLPFCYIHNHILCSSQLKIIHPNIFHKNASSTSSPQGTPTQKQNQSWGTSRLCKRAKLADSVHYISSAKPWLASGHSGRFHSPSLTINHWPRHHRLSRGWLDALSPKKKNPMKMVRHADAMVPIPTDSSPP